jgi:hypothetical protein
MTIDNDKRPVACDNSRSRVFDNDKKAAVAIGDLMKIVKEQP